MSKVKKPLTEEELLDLKFQITKAKNQQSEIQGKRNYLLSELADKYGCNSIAKAEKKMAELAKEIEELNSGIAVILAQIGNKWHE